jgi:DNA-binding IclR family transcriptional regulator
MKGGAPTGYVNQSLRNGLKVMRALLDAPSRGYSVRDIEKKTGIAYHQCYSALITLEIEGCARRFVGAWKPGDGLRILAARTDLAFARQDSDVLALADSMREF